MQLYHGTNRLLDVLMPPSRTGNLREQRKANKDVVFATSSLQMAKGYAGTAAKQFGGEAIILLVEGEFRPWKNKIGCTIFVAPSAKVVDSF